MNKITPFSFYDFLGYLIPGSMALFIILMLQKCISLNCLDFSFVLSQSTIIDFNNVFILIVTSYVLGHIISYISSVSIEKYSVWKLGYPSKYLLGYSAKDYFYEDLGKKRLFYRLLNAIFLLPFILWDVFIGDELKMNTLIAKPLDKSLSNLVKLKISQFMKCEYPEIDAAKHAEENDYFRIIYHYIVEKSPSHFPKLQNYVALYGFARTLTLIFVLLSWSIVIVWKRVNLNISQAIFAFLIFSFMGYIMNACFNKFYRKFSLEAYMALLVVYKKTTNTKT